MVVLLGLGWVLLILVLVVHFRRIKAHQEVELFLSCYALYLLLDDVALLAHRGSFDDWLKGTEFKGPDDAGLQAWKATENMARKLGLEGSVKGTTQMIWKRKMELEK